MDAKARYNKNHYKQYTFTLNKEKDAELINKIQVMSEKHNVSNAEAIRQMLYGAKK